MSCCDNKNEEKKDNRESQLTCPVMGSPVDKAEAEKRGLVREYKGEKYYFCCDGCPQKFDNDPEIYIGKTPVPHDKNGCC